MIVSVTGGGCASAGGCHKLDLHVVVQMFVHLVLVSNFYAIGGSAIAGGCASGKGDCVGNRWWLCWCRGCVS
jgi:hypothetical protein